MTLPAGRCLQNLIRKARMTRNDQQALDQAVQPRADMILHPRPMATSLAAGTGKKLSALHPACPPRHPLLTCTNAFGALPVTTSSLCLTPHRCFFPNTDLSVMPCLKFLDLLFPVLMVPCKLFLFHMKCFNDDSCAMSKL